MKTLKQISVAALAGVAMMAGSAYAADPVTNYAVEAPAYAAPGFDWNRYYLGLETGWLSQGGNHWGIGGIAGINIQDGSLVYGGELEASALVSGGAITGGQYEATARVGTLVADDVLLYGVGGAAHTDGVGAGVVGAGIEFAINDNVTLGSEYNYLFNNGGTVGHEVDGKLRFYFD